MTDTLMPVPEEDSKEEKEKEEDTKNETENAFETEYNSDDTVDILHSNIIKITKWKIVK